MLTLKTLGPDGLRREVERERQDDSHQSSAGRADSPGLAAQTRDGSLGRKAAATSRLLVDAQRHRALIEAHVLRNYQDPTTRVEILGHVDVLRNLQREVTARVAIAYNTPPARSLRGVPPEQEREFLRAYKEAHTDTAMERVNRLSFFLAVTLVLPRYASGRLEWVIVTPDKVDALFDGETGERSPSILVYESKAHGAAYVAVDAERWQWLSSSWAVILEEEHGMGCVPWVAFRWSDPPEMDWYDRGHGQDLYEATLDIGRVSAHMRWVRKHWARNLFTIHVGQNVELPEGQNISANQPLFTRGDGAAVYDVHQTTAAVDEFSKEMAEIEAAALRAYGLSPADLAMGGAGPSPALVKLHERQAKGYADAELELAVRAAKLLTVHGRTNITEEQVRESFRCRHARLSYADKARLETDKLRLEMGQTDPYRLYADETGETYQEATASVDRHVEARGRFYEHWIAHNVPADPSDDLRTPAQLNGKLGGQLSGLVRQQQQDDDDE